MEFELIDRSQHEPDPRNGKRQRAIFIPEEDREKGEQDHSPGQMNG